MTIDNVISVNPESLQILPKIDSLEDLASCFAIEIGRLANFIAKTESQYHTFKIAKRRGGFRELSAPSKPLYNCQNWIYKNILCKQQVHESVNGFVLNKSIITNALPHLNKKAMLKIDIEDFFPSIKINWVINYFNKLGYSNDVSYYLAKICCLDDKLPQGAPTSPSISNLLLHSLDLRLNNLSKSYNLSYSRYADDMTFSGDYIPHNFISIVSSIIKNFGLNPNKSKTKLSFNKGKRIVTGISVSDTELKIPREKKRELRKEIHYISKFGLNSHISRNKSTPVNYLNVLEGKIIFWLQVEPNNEFAKNSLNLIRDIKISLNK